MFQILKRWLAVLSCAWLAAFAGCANQTPFRQDSGLDDDNSGKLIVYRPRTFYQRGNPDRPFFYIDDQKVGQLGVGSSIRLKLRPGQYRLDMRESILFQPTYVSRSLTLTVSPGETYYVRYSQEFKSVIPIPKAPVITDDTSFVIVPSSVGQAGQ